MCAFADHLPQYAPRAWFLWIFGTLYKLTIIIIFFFTRSQEGKTAYELAKELEHTPVMSAIEAKEKEIHDRWKKGKKAGVCAIL